MGKFYLGGFLVLFLIHALISSNFLVCRTKLGNNLNDRKLIMILKIKLVITILIESSYRLSYLSTRLNLVFY